MWNTVCTNKICFTQEKRNEQNLHLNRLYCIRPQINITEPFVPEFLRVRGPQREKLKQTQEKINYENNLLNKKIIETYLKNGKYSKYTVEPKEVYPAFRRYSRLKINDIIKIININLENQRLENKLSNLKATYDNNELRKEAEKQERYLHNLLNRPKSIPFTPALKFISIEQLHNQLKNKILRQGKILNKGEESKRGNSSVKIRRSNTNNSKMNLVTSENNKSGNKTNRTQRSQSSKHRKELHINSDNDIQIENNKKVKKETGTTKSTTAAEK